MSTTNPSQSRRAALRPWTGWQHQPGWLLLPLRGFLGVTFTYAGLQKLANPGYFDPHNPTSVAGQMLMLQKSSPIGWLLGLSAHAPTLVGLLIAFGELAVGVGTLAGLWTRGAAAGGALLSLMFFLTVSWNTAPYYYGSDVVFVFAWLVMIGFGSGGVLSMDAWLRNRARREFAVEPLPAATTVAPPPVQRLPPRIRRDLNRRTAVLAGSAAAIAGAAVLATGGVAAAAGRLVDGTRKAATVAGSAPAPAPAPTTLAPRPLARRSSEHGPSSETAASRARAPRVTEPATTRATAAPTTKAPVVTGTAVAAAASVPVGHAVAFTNPADGSPAWVVHPTRQKFVAFSAICTHAGCTVGYDSSTTQFVCPCHGGIFDGRTGRVLQGPPESPLPSIQVNVVNGEIRAV